MSGSGSNASRPGSWEAFEELVAEIVVHEWGDPEGTRHGREDERRHCVDIHCRPAPLDGDHCGVYCVPTDELSVETVREAVEAAEDFDPELEEFVVATTASRDDAVDAEVRSLSADRESENRFRVRVLWWGDVAGLLGSAAAERGDLEAAEARYRQRLEAVRDADDAEGEADSHGSLGSVALQRDDLDAAEEHFRRSLQIRERTGDEHGAARSHRGLGRVARDRDDWETAREHFQQASETFLEVGAGHDALDVLDDLVTAHNRTGHEDEAVEVCGIAIGVADELDLPEVERRFRVRYAALPGRNTAEGTDELYSFALENVVDPDPDAAVVLFDRTWGRRDEVPAGSGARARTHAAGVFLAALAELYDLERGDEAVDPDTLLDAAADTDVDLPDPVAPIAARLRGEDPGVTPDDVDGDVELDEDGELAAEDLEKLAAATVLDALE